MSNSENLRKSLTEDELKRLRHIIKGHKSGRDEAIFLVACRRGLSVFEFSWLPPTGWNPSKRKLYVTRLNGSLSLKFPIHEVEQATRPTSPYNVESALNDLDPTVREMKRVVTTSPNQGFRGMRGHISGSRGAQVVNTPSYRGQKHTLSH